MAAKGKEKSELSPLAKKAVKKLQSIEDALLTVQATVGTYVKETQEVKEMFLGKPEKEENGDQTQ